ncbi:unnamed protein product [Cyprideis torosa]|uniref:Uncharacterized protein n=1 Tax=Cyprideis torosa TaxID=163714 RepID=A0A7R8WCW9_9CRUS|nr:unnamed protein product [Cyprideis torosa]CAG0894009.1 unnamed protein product [Cyprideis torosa]
MQSPFHHTASDNDSRPLVKTMSALVRLGRLVSRGFSPQKFSRRCLIQVSSNNVVCSTIRTRIPDDLTVPEFCYQNLDRISEMLAVTDGVRGTRKTHGDIQREATQFGGSLLELGMMKGDVLSVLLNNCPEYSVAFFGSNTAGIIFSPLNPNYSPEEIAGLLDLSGSSFVLTEGAILNVVMEALKLCKARVKGLIAAHTQPELVKKHSNQGLPFFDFDDLVRRGRTDWSQPKIDPQRDLSILPFSSGTTGFPKGVMLTHGNLVANLAQINEPKVSHFISLEEGTDMLIGLLPYFHIYGLICILCSGSYHGAHTVTLDKLHPPVFMKIIREYRPTVLHLVPPLLNFLLNYPDAKADDFTSIRVFLCGAAPVSSNLFFYSSRFLHKALSVRALIPEGYGMTEASPVTHLTPPSKPKYGSCGLPVPNTEAVIRDISTGENLPANKRGEICIRGPQVMKGYWNNEEATAATIDEEGWLRTGDVGLFDEDGYFWVVDRVKELIKVKGLQVAPAELENLLLKHPRIADCAVIGVPDAEVGERPRAYVVARGQITEQEVAEHVKEHLSAHKHLTGGVELVEVIPKSATGKILRRELKDGYLKRLDGGQK